MEPPHILLVSLGVRPQMVCYRLGNCEQRAEFASIALLRLLPVESRPREIIALVTSAASEKSWAPFSSAANEAGVNVKRVDVLEGRDAEQIRQMLESIAHEFPDGSYCTLDLTGGLRHFPFLFYALALYLSSLRGVIISGAYYGMLEGCREGESAPLIDLRPLLDLPEWFFAVRQFRRTGDASAAAVSFKSIADGMKARAEAAGHDREMHKRAGSVKKLADRLGELTFATAAALPLEIGEQACGVERCATSDAAQSLAIEAPLGGTLVDLLRTTAAEFALPLELCGSGRWKPALMLDVDELRRQARLVDRHIERQQLPLAAGLMREWAVSLILFHAGEKLWLAGKSRKNAERRLGTLSAALVKDSGIVLTEEQRPWASFWNMLGAIRNSLHHHGMREEVVSSTPGGWIDVLAFWQKIKNAEIAPPPFGGGSGRLLISPLGQRPGVLYSALRKSEPERCLVLCSTATRAGVDAATEAAKCTAPVELLEIADPHAGFSEISALIRAARLQLLAADEVVVNLTGGTTLMGIAAQQLAESAGGLMRPVRRMVLIDRRPPQEQDREPFVESDCHWLDGSLEEEKS